jgi:hypothetical protein
VAAEAGTGFSVSSHEVFTRLLLALPRSATDSAVVAQSVAKAEAEAERQGSHLREITAPLADWLSPPTTPTDVTDLEFAPVAEDVARPVLERFHYLESFRPASEHHG